MPKPQTKIDTWDGFSIIKRSQGCPCNFFATENKKQNERESVFAAQYSPTV